MARIDYWQYLVDRQGRPLEEAEVRIYLSGTLIEANIFLHPEFGSFTTSSVQLLTTNKFGFIQFWLGDRWEVEGGYSENQTFKIVWQNTVDSIEEQIDNLFVFSPVKPIEITNVAVDNEPDAHELNRVISNSQGYKWDTHVDSIVPSASPHDLEPVVFFDTDGISNRVISDKLGYQMHEMANNALTTSIDVSASRLYTERVSSWNTSGGSYYRNIRHNFNNYFPIVRIQKYVEEYQIQAKRIEAIDPDYTRVWVDDNSLDVQIAIFG